MIRRSLVALLALPLCGWVQLRAGDAPDSPPLRFTSGVVVRYHVHGDGYSGLPLHRVRAAIDRAFATWERPCSTLRFEPDPEGVDGDTPAQDGRNVLRFEEGRLPPEVDPERTLAFTSHVGVFCTGVIVESDITFNAVTVAWSDREVSRRADIETVALHEIGHLLGLDHSRFRDAVMYPSIVERVRRDLSPDELEAICALYPRDRGQPCDGDADCRGGEVCILGLSSDEVLEPRCGPPLGRAGPAEPCAAGRNFCASGCANGLCLDDGVCSAVCRDDGDCPPGWSCIPQSGEGGGPDYALCLDVRTCEDDADACPRGQACLPVSGPTGSDVIRLCVDSPGRGAVGDPCDSPDACAGALCIGGVCSRVCDRDGDCGGFPCAPRELPGLPGEVSVCAVPTETCGRQADCGDAGLTCAFVEQDGRSTTRCVPASGAAAGAACGEDGDCRSGACLESGRCTAVCRADADCPAGMECGRLRLAGVNQLACVPVEAPPADAGPAPTPADAALADAGDPDAGPPVLAPDGAPPRVDGAPVAPSGDAAAGDPPLVVERGGGDAGCAATGAGAPLPLAVLALLGLRRRRARR